MTFPGGLVMSAESGHPNRCYAWMGELSPEIGALTSTLLRSGDTFVDIGAFTGQYSIRASIAVGEHGRVIAFEPDPRNLDQLTKNIELSGYTSRIATRPFAVAAESGLVELHLHPQRSMSSLNPNFHGESLGCVEVQSVSISELQREFDPRVIKMDVEGLEPELIKLLQSSEHHFGPYVIAEDNPGVSEAFTQRGWWWVCLQDLVKDDSPTKGAYGSRDILAAPVEPRDLDEIRIRFNAFVSDLLDAPAVAYGS